MAEAERPGAWETVHEQTYKEGPWVRVQRLAWELTKRVIGYDPGDIDRIEEDGGSAEADPTAHQDRLTRWMPASRLLALALWRAARDADVLVDEVPLNRALWWLGGARHHDLYADPLPEWSRTLPGSWGRVQQREELLLESARSIATWHLVQDLKENAALRDTADGTPEPEPPLLLGDRCRALASGPYRDGHRPRWAGTVEYAVRGLTRASDELRAGRWVPGPAARHAAAALHPSLVATPDAPEMPDEVTEPAWIQRAVRLAHLHTTIGAIQDHHGHGGDLDSHPRQPFGSALASTAVALDEIGATVHELEAAWARRDASVALWERAHLPVAVREHITALESMISVLAGLCFYMNNTDEAH